LSRASVELVGDGVELELGAVTQAGVAREVLAEQPVGVLVAAALAGAARITEVDGYAAGDGEHGVLCHLAALSQVRERRRCLGSSVILAASVAATTSARWVSGSPTSITNRLCLSTSVATTTGALAVEEVAFRKGVDADLGF
jgi:hypothetical protein